MSSCLNVHREAGHWVIELSRPEKRNALSEHIVEELIHAVDTAHAEGVPLLVFKGAGKNFSAGFDFTGFEDQSEGDLVLRMIRIETLLQKGLALPSQTMAFAHGGNFGAGVDLFAACKFRYATADAAFRMPGLKFGLILGTRRFRNLVGDHAALSILGTARSFSVNEALDIGFVHHIAAQSDWPELIRQGRESAETLDTLTRASLYQVLSRADDDADMAALVRSASEPGFKTRIRNYLRV